MSRFEALTTAGALAPIDRCFGELIHRRAGSEHADELALTAALLSHERGRGHSCLEPARWAGRPFPGDAGRSFPGDAEQPLPELPPLPEWETALAASPLVGDGTAPTPLVRDAAGRLYLYRYWRAEQRLAERLRARLGAPPPALDTAALAPLFRRLFPPPPPGEVDWQAVAAVAALRSPMTLVSGGPGTGKTTTVTRILALLLAATPDLRIALAAPTGKAAARLGEAIAEQLERLPIDDELRRRIPTGASTLHRLLRYRPRRERFHHDARRPLPRDLLVIDEASMVDLLLMDAAVDALPPRGRLLLLGDRDQLASVETGFVFGDLCAAARGPFSPAFAELAESLGQHLAPDDVAQTGGGALPDAAVELRVSYRFRDRPGIGELATAIRERDPERALAELAGSGVGEVEQLAPPAELDTALEPIAGALDAYLAAASPAEALQRLARFRVLCARRRGPWGVERLNTAVERRLAERGHRVGERWYPGRPVMVVHNDYQIRLFNGDLGVCWQQDGALHAFFPGPEDTLRRLPLAKLPPHDTAWAMTVHKSQGSEFDRVLLVLGDTDHPLHTRELLYTGVTRARRRVDLVASSEVLRAAIERVDRRASGLAEALGVAAAAPERRLEKQPTRKRPKAGAGPRQLSLFEL